MKKENRIREVICRFEKKIFSVLESRSRHAGFITEDFEIQSSYKVQVQSQLNTSRSMMYLVMSGFIIFLLSACISDNVSWRKNNTPKNKDKDVRFKTTYYFRVIDSCEPPTAAVVSNIPIETRRNNLLNPVSETSHILSDTLYRFNLTGKADAWSHAKFEAGTLRADQIDPFGNTVEADDNNNFRYVSAAEGDHKRQINDSKKNLKDIEARLKSIGKQLSELKEDKNPSSETQATISILEKDRETLTQAKSAIYGYLYGRPKEINSNRGLPYIQSQYVYRLDAKGQESVNAIGGMNESPLAQSLAKSVANIMGSPGYKLLSADEALNIFHQAETFLNNKKDSNPDSVPAVTTLTDIISNPLNVQFSNTSSACPPGLSRHHGYLIFGPEGWRRFAPDERLILAMYTSSRPLISTMSELSHRLKNAHDSTDNGDSLVVEEVSFISQQQIEFLTQSNNAETNIELNVDQLISAMEKR